MQDIKIPLTSGGPQEEKQTPQAAGNDDGEPTDAVKVKFGKFMQLIASHNFEEVLRNHEEDDIIVSSNLLTDLASAHEEENPDSSRKLPLILLIGIIVGIIITYLVFQF